jgi:hypothetical protein
VRIALVLLVLAPAVTLAEDETCTYRTYAWSSVQKKGVGHQRVSKPRSALTDEERDPNEPRCTVCSEDQVKVAVKGVPAVTVCKVFAADVEKALTEIRDSGVFEIRALKGYRPGRTRGPIRKGLRTVFSNHSYGAAIDINAGQNALYRRCRTQRVAGSAKDIAHCKRGVGGAWDPKARPRTTIVEGGVVHTTFTRFWKWGGALEGSLKDFMHFSVTGE